MKKYILIFRTSVRNKQDIKRIEALFVQFPQIDKWHVDLEGVEDRMPGNDSGYHPKRITDYPYLCEGTGIASVAKPIGLTTSRSFSP